jgi:predicted ATPase with chaperone activity
VRAARSIQQRCVRRVNGRWRARAKPTRRLQSQEIDQQVLLDDAATAKFLNVAATRLGWSARSTHRALKVARTIADWPHLKSLRCRIWRRPFSTAPKFRCADLVGCGADPAQSGA